MYVCTVGIAKRTAFLINYYLFISVAIGRLLLHCVGLLDAPEMYTASIGLYLMWISIKFSITIIPYALEGTTLFFRQLKSWIYLVIKCALAGTILFLIIPLIMGHLVELILLSPLRVPVDKFPVFYPSTVSMFSFPFPINSISFLKSFAGVGIGTSSYQMHIWIDLAHRFGF